MNYTASAQATFTTESLFVFIFKMPVFANGYHYQKFGSDVIFSTFYLEIDVWDSVNTQLNSYTKWHSLLNSVIVTALSNLL